MTTYLKFLDGEAATEAAGWRNERRLAIARDAARADLAVGSTVTFQVRSVDNAGNKSDWVTSKTVVVGATGSGISMAGDTWAY